MCFFSLILKPGQKVEFEMTLNLQSFKNAAKMKYFQRKEKGPTFPIIDNKPLNCKMKMLVLRLVQLGVSWLI